MNATLYDRLVAAVRLLLGVEFTVNGLNWWVKLITPYPSISDGVAFLPSGDFVAAMIKTGILFHVVKALELLAGLALLANRFVPLALVAVLSVTVNVFIVDVFLGHKLRSFIMGSGALLMNAFLMSAYFEHYRPLLAARTHPDPLIREGGEPLGPRVAWLLRYIRPVLAILAVPIGAVMVGWVAVMIVQRLAA